MTARWVPLALALLAACPQSHRRAVSRPAVALAKIVIRCTSDSECLAAAPICANARCDLTRQECSFVPKGRPNCFCYNGAALSIAGCSNGGAAVCVATNEDGDAHARCVQPLCESCQRRCSPEGKPQSCSVEGYWADDGPDCAADQACVNGVCCARGLGSPCGPCGGMIRCDGGCSVRDPEFLGKSCGSCGGTFQCNGSCSVVDPPDLGKPCGSCGGKVVCGGCSVVDPPDLGQPCGNCGGKVVCGGGCDRPNPPGYGDPCGCGGRIQCDGGCSKPDCVDGKVCQAGKCTCPQGAFMCGGECCPQGRCCGGPVRGICCPGRCCIRQGQPNCVGPGEPCGGPGSPP
jgi:hypothetical protein